MTALSRFTAALAAESEMGGLLYPEIRATVETTRGLLRDHKQTQQELGLLPKITPAAKDAGNDGVGGDPTASAELKGIVRRFVENRGQCGPSSGDPC